MGRPVVTNLLIPFQVPREFLVGETPQQVLERLFLDKLLFRGDLVTGVATGLRKWGSVWEDEDRPGMFDAQVRASLSVLALRDGASIEEALHPSCPVELEFIACPGTTFRGYIFQYERGRNAH